MTEIPNFNSPEEEINYLEQKILEKRKEVAGQSSKEVVSESIKEHTENIKSSVPPPQVPPTKPDDDEIDKDVAVLVQTAFAHGIVEATKQVRNTHNPYLIDAFHDALVDKFLDDMKNRGVLEVESNG
ncbi:MAG: hypothetical protein O2794_01950 [bacterium]|nr:hypothetical protein [bacterium]